MSFAAQIRPNLPFLRRYARALTGSQRSGDAYILASLDALKNSPQLVVQGSTPRVTLYRFFHSIWTTTGARLEAISVAGALAVELRLRQLAPVERQAFLLTTLEGFTRMEASEIMGLPKEEIERLLDKAHREIEKQLATSVVIIEDEEIIVAHLARIVEELGHMFAGSASTHEAAVDLVRAIQPGLVLCDVQLSDDTSGIEAIKDILSEFDLPVIFITGYPEHLLTGERPEPTYLVTKPFEDDTVKAAISQALFFRTEFSSALPHD